MPKKKKNQETETIQPQEKESEVSLTETSSKIKSSKIDDLRNEDKKQVETSEKKSGKKRGRKKKKQAAFSTESMKHLLRLPFSVGGMLTGFSYDPIQPPIDQPLAESAVIVAQEFGIDYLEKWGNLAVFVALYGTCAADWFTRFKQYRVEDQIIKLPESLGNGTESE